MYKYTMRCLKRILEDRQMLGYSEEEEWEEEEEEEEEEW
jgi:hypothetical protein